MFLGVVGDPIAHSLSPVIHKTVFAELGIPLRYEKYRVAKGSLDEWLLSVRDEGIEGFNVTMPHKRDIVKYCAILPPARYAVNTVRAEDDGSLSGFSTDEGGFMLSLSEMGFDVAGKNVVIAGQGGVAQSLSVTLSSLGATVNCISARSDISAFMPEADLMINATPLGMAGQDWADLSFLRALPKAALVYDLLYNPPVTSLLREASALGLRTQNGLAMLIYQAILSDEIYLRRTLDVSALKAAALAAL